MEEAASIAEKTLNLDQILGMAQLADNLYKPPFHQKDKENISLYSRVRIGVFRDSAFQFYYPENIEALTSRGADIIEISALESKPLPTVDALYIGGGFPETNAQRLADNLVFKDSVRLFVERGGPVYAECGGLMYLAKTLVVDNKEFPMAGIFPASSVLNKRPQGLGYVELRARASNVFFREGQLIRGHEFHYSTMILDHNDQESWPFDVLRGHGVDGAHDGLQVRNALGIYAHVHALGEPSWADALVRKAREFHTAQETNT